MTIKSRFWFWRKSCHWLNTVPPVEINFHFHLVFRNFTNAILYCTPGTWQNSVSAGHKTFKKWGNIILIHWLGYTGQLPNINLNIRQQRWKLQNPNETPAAKCTFEKEKKRTCVTLSTIRGFGGKKKKKKKKVRWEREITYTVGWN